MVSLTGKSRVGSTRASMVGAAQSRPSVGGRNFKVFSEIDRTKAGDGNTTSARGTVANSRRSTVVASKGNILGSTSNPKGGLKQSMDKSSGKYGTSNTAVRKALADVSNVEEKFTSAVGHANSKMKVSTGSSTKIVGVSLRKSITGRVQRNNSKADVRLDALNKDDQKNNTKGGQSVFSTKDRFTWKTTATSTSRKSLPVPRRVIREDTSKTKENVRSSLTAKGQSCLPSKATTIRRESSQLVNARNHLWKNRVSDGFVLTVQPNVSHASSRKSAKPIVKTTLKASIAQRTLKSKSISAQSKLESAIATSSQNKSISAQNKLESTTATLSQEKESVSLSLPGNGSIVSDDANQRDLPSESTLRTDLSEIIPRKKSSRRKSYTSSLIEGSKFLKESEVREQDNLPSIDNESNQFEVSESVSLSLPGNGSIVSDDANQRDLPSESTLRTDLSEIIPRKKSSRRKSYTSSLIEGSKFLKESEVREQDNLPSIDNESNQFEVSEYVDDIYEYYWVTEARNPALANYMSIQTDITPHLRGILINWLIEVHFKFELMPETLYLTVTLLDQYLSLVTIKKTDMQLVGLTALLLASKYEDFWHPRVKDLISISAGYTRDEMLGMEKLILRKLKFRLNAPTHYVFLVRFLKAGQSNKKIEHMAFFLVDLCLVEYEALAFKPSLLCASALYVARCTLQVSPPWTPLLHKHARYELSQLRDCAEMILKFHKAAGVGKLTVAYEKYSRPELCRVAAVKPLDVLPL